jgi:hypothetical protein
MKAQARAIAITQLAEARQLHFCERSKDIRFRLQWLTTHGCAPIRDGSGYHDLPARSSCSEQESISR